jgi:hypothetical protein
MKKYCCDTHSLFYRKWWHLTPITVTILLEQVR